MYTPTESAGFGPAKPYGIMLRMKSSAESNDSSAWFWACWLSLAATFVLVAVASFMPERRLWGINHLAFHPPFVRFAVLCVTGLLFVPPLATATWRGVVWLLRPFFKGVEGGANAIALTGVISFVVFAAFRSSTRLLGDGYFIVTNLQMAAENQLGMGGFFQQVTSQERVYPATEFLNFAASWLAGSFGASPAGGVWIVNCALGAIVVVGLLATVGRSGWSRGTRFAVLALALFSGAVELFFGYVEHYTAALALGAMYLMTGVRALSGAGRPLAPGLALAAAVLFHVQGVLLAPSYAWLLYWIVVCKRNPARGAVAAVVVGALTIVAAIATGLTPALSRFFLPPLGSGGNYGVFSGAHLLDALNGILLLVPAWSMLALLAIRRIRTRHGAYAPFGWCLAVPAVLFLLLFKPELGMARDWDVYCFAVFGLAAPGLFALVGYLEDTSFAHRAPALLAPAVAVAAAVAIPWVGVNADPERSVTRYHAILTYDLTHPGYAYENLARHYKDNYQYSRQIAALRRAHDSSHNPRYLKMLGIVRYENSDPSGAAVDLAAFLKARPNDDEVRKILLRILAGRNAVDEMIEVSLEGIEYSPRVPDYHFFLGNAYLAKGMTEDGLKAFETCSRLNPPPVMVIEMNRLTDRIRQGRPNQR
jgi:hypothetical protein